MKTIYIFISLLFFSNLLLSQHLLEATVFGEDQQPLPGTTVVLLENQDSSMVAFSIADDKGRFELEDVEKGDYILQLSFVSFQTQQWPITVSGEEKKMNLGSYTMETSEEILQEVEVKAEHIPMGILGDTINYNAAAFKTRPGATVEDLLKKLPGVEVERDGSIKAMGEDVENVLVDGKEFFGDDPKIATRNLEAEAIDKVQVFDKKSEIAEFTGVEDGQDEKTINLKLKEEYKNGGFGNVEVKGATDDRYYGKLNYNRFSPKMQAAAIVNLNNINEQAFTFNEYIGFMGGLGNAVSNTSNLFNFGEFGGGFTPRGITDGASTGLNFNYDFSKKFKLQSHYFYLRDDLQLNSNSINNQFTENQSFLTRDTLQSNRINQNHRLSLKLHYKPNPTTQLIWKNNGSGILNNISSASNTQFFTNMLSTGTTNSALNTSNEQLGIDGNIQFRKKFAKKGRNWISNAKYQFGNFEELQALVNIFELTDKQATIDQIQDFRFTNNGLGLNTAFTEPIGKGVYLSATYNFDMQIEEPKKTFLDVSNGAAILNTDLSSEYVKTNYQHKGGLSIKRNTKKTKFNSGIAFQGSTILGELNREEEPLKNNSRYLLPNLSWEYSFDRKSTFKFYYLTRVNLPTLSQLAPLPDNSNPNLLLIGNPNLDPEYVHRAQLSYSLFDQFNFTNLYASFNFELTKNWINNNIGIDDQFLKTIRPENISEHFNYSGNISYSAPIKPLKLKFRTHVLYSLANYEGRINDLSGAINEGNVNIKFSLENRKKEQLDIAAGIDLNLSTTKYAVNSDFNQQFFNTKLFIEGDWFIGDEWTLSSSLDYISYSSEFFSEGVQYALWNAKLGRSFKENKWALELSVYDILKQNVGLSRSGDLNGLTENYFNTLSQYVMLGLRYRVGKRKKQDATIF